VMVSIIKPQRSSCSPDISKMVSSTKDDTTICNTKKKDKTQLRQTLLHSLSRSLGCQLTEGLQGPTPEPNERS
jgi:hypothetical protein